MIKGAGFSDKLFTFLIIGLMILYVAALTGCVEEDKAQAEMEVLYAEARMTGTQNWMTPKDGYEFLWVQVEITNMNEKEDLSLHAWYFELVTAEGSVYANARTEGAPDRIIAGATINFWVIFEIPTEEKGNILRFTPSWFQDEPFTDDIPPY